MRTSDGHLHHIALVHGVPTALPRSDGTIVASQRDDNQPIETLTAKTLDHPGSPAAGTASKVLPDPIVTTEAAIEANYLAPLQGKADTD